MDSNVAPIEIANMTPRQRRALLNGVPVTIIVKLANGQIHERSVSQSMLLAFTTAASNMINNNQLDLTSLDFGAVKHVIDWMVNCCKTQLFYNLPFLPTFRQNIQLFKVVDVLGIEEAYHRFFDRISFLIRVHKMNAEHLDAVCSNFAPTSNLFIHLVNALGWEDQVGTITESAQQYLSMHPEFAAIVEEARQARLTKQRESRERYQEQQRALLQQIRRERRERARQSKLESAEPPKDSAVDERTAHLG